MLTASNYLRGLRTQEWQCVRVCVGSTYAVVVPLPHSLPLSLALLAINGTCSVRNIKKKSAAGARPDQAHCRGKRERVRNGMGGAHTPTESRRRNKQKNESKFTTHTHTTQASSVSGKWRQLNNKFSTGSSIFSTSPSPSSPLPPHPFIVLLLSWADIDTFCRLLGAYTEKSFKVIYKTNKKEMRKYKSYLFFGSI